MKMTQGIKKMEAMGFTFVEVDTEDKFNRGLVRQFVKYDHKDRVTDIINFYYSKSVGVEVYANSLKYGCGSRLDTELLNVIQLNCEEIKEKENEKHEGKYTFIIAGRGAAKTKAMQEYYNKFIKEK